MFNNTRGFNDYTNLWSDTFKKGYVCTNEAGDRVEFATYEQANEYRLENRCQIDECIKSKETEHVLQASTIKSIWED